MKKLVSFLVVVALLVVFMVPAFAANGINGYEKKLINYVETAYTVEGGKTITVPEEYITALENMFTTVDVTQDQYDKVISILNEALAYVRNKKLVKVSDIPATGSTQDLLNYADRVFKVFGCKVTTKGHITDADHGLLIMSDPNGRIISELHPAVIIKTGPNYSSAILFGLAAAAVLAVAGVSVKRFRKKADED